MFAGLTVTQVSDFERVHYPTVQLPLGRRADRLVNLYPPSYESDRIPLSKPVALFVCQRNTSRSQLGAALLEILASNRHTAVSAGVTPAEAINPAIEATIAELGRSSTQNHPTTVFRPLSAARPC